MRPGSCPPPEDVIAQAAVCTEACHHDRDCEGIRKCCAHSCGRACVNPAHLYQGNVQYFQKEWCKNIVLLTGEECLQSGKYVIQMMESNIELYWTKKKVMSDEAQQSPTYLFLSPITTSPRTTSVLE